MKKILKSSLYSITIIAILFLNFSPALADFDWPSPSEAASEGADSITEKYGIDQNAIVEEAQLFNNIQQKQQYPTVSLSFSPTSPIPGQKITATAQPSYFGNDTEKLYYTWFLRHANQTDSKDIELFKQQAMQVIANAGFDYEEEAYNQDTDNDGYKAYYGGDDQKNVGEEAHCFFSDTEEGKTYEFTECGHLFPNAPGAKTGDGKFDLGEEQFWHTNPNDPDTGDYGLTDEAVVTGLGQTTFSWTYKDGDQVGVAIEGISYEPTAYDDASYKVMWALPKDECDLIGDAFRDPNDDTEETVTVSPETWPSCPGGCTFVRTVTKSTTSYEQASYSSYTLGTTTKIVKTEQIRLNPQGDAFTGTITDGSIEIAGESGEEGEAPSNETCYAIDGLSSDVGITDRSCCPDGNNYCSKLSSRTETTTGNKNLDIDQDDKDRNLFKMKISDLNKCLVDNFIDPINGGGKYQKMEVDLSYAPNNPINDPEGNNSDELTITSSISNSDDSDYLYYSWVVYTGNSIDGPWTKLTKSALTDSTPTMGLGASDLSFKLDFPEEDEVTHIKVKLTVSEEAYNGTKKSSGEIIIPIYDNSNRIKVFATSVSDSLKFSLAGDEKCITDNLEDPVCKVAKNQIIGVTIDDSELDSFYWKVDNEPFSYAYTASDSESSGIEKAPNPAYFPVLKEIGDTFDVTLTATNKNTGEKIELIKSFEVANPTVAIASANENTCKPILRGYYIDSNDVKWPDYYDDFFQGVYNKDINLKANFTGAEPLEEDQTQWYLNGYLAGTGSEFSFESDQEPGGYDNVTVTSLFQLDNNTIKALDKFWDAPESLFYEENMSDSIKIKMLSSAEEFTAQKNRRLMASLFASFPQYLGFLFRLTLTAALLIFSSKIAFSLTKIKD